MKQHLTAITLISALAALTLIVSTEFTSRARAAAIASYTASADPGVAPDANAGTADVWSLTFTDVGGGGAGSFLDGRGWTIWTSPFGGDPATQTEAVRADHSFVGGPLTVGQTVSLRWANSAILAARSVGVSLTSGGAPVITVKFVGQDPDGVYRYDDAGGVNQNTGQGFQFQTMSPLVITLNSATTYSASYNGTPWAGTYSGTIDGIRVFNDRAGDGSDVYFNNLAIVPEPSAGALALLAAVGLPQRWRRRR
jgi:hypothetical protein